jgi:hypothetical protein
MMFRSVMIAGACALAPWVVGTAQPLSHKPDAQTPRVVVMAGFNDSMPELAVLIAAVAQQRVPQMVSRNRLWLVSKRDIDNTLITEWTPKLPEDYGEIAKLVRAVGAVVVTAHGRRDSIDVIGSIVMARKQPVDSVRFRAPSAAAVDSLLVRLLADVRFRRGGT